MRSVIRCGLVIRCLAGHPPPFWSSAAYLVIRCPLYGPARARPPTARPHQRRWSATCSWGWPRASCAELHHISSAFTLGRQSSPPNVVQFRALGRPVPAISGGAASGSVKRPARPCRRQTERRAVTDVPTATCSWGWSRARCAELHHSSSAFTLGGRGSPPNVVQFRAVGRPVRAISGGAASGSVKRPARPCRRQTERRAVTDVPTATCSWGWSRARCAELHHISSAFTLGGRGSPPNVVQFRAVGRPVRAISGGAASGSVKRPARPRRRQTERRAATNVPTATCSWGWSRARCAELHHISSAFTLGRRGSPPNVVQFRALGRPVPAISGGAASGSVKRPARPRRRQTERRAATNVPNATCSWGWSRARCAELHHSSSAFTLGRRGSPPNVVQFRAVGRPVRAAEVQARVTSGAVPILLAFTLRAVRCETGSHASHRPIQEAAARPL